MPFDPEVADEFCARLIDGRSMRSICNDKDMPSSFTIFKWLDELPLFARQYARARELQADALFDECQEIADNPKMGIETKTNDDGVETKESDMIQHRRLQIDTRKWMAGKMRPKKYGTVEATEADDGTVIIKGGLPD